MAPYRPSNGYEWMSPTEEYTAPRAAPSPPRRPDPTGSVIERPIVLSSRRDATRGKRSKSLGMASISRPVLVSSGRTQLPSEKPLFTHSKSRDPSPNRMRPGGVETIMSEPEPTAGRGRKRAVTLTRREIYGNERDGSLNKALISKPLPEPAWQKDVYYNPLSSAKPIQPRTPANEQQKIPWPRMQTNSVSPPPIRGRGPWPSHSSTSPRRGHQSKRASREKLNSSFGEEYVPLRTYGKPATASRRVPRQPPRQAESPGHHPFSDPSEEQYSPLFTIERAGAVSQTRRVSASRQTSVSTTVKTPGSASSRAPFKAAMQPPRQQSSTDAARPHGVHFSRFEGSHGLQDRHR